MNFRFWKKKTAAPDALMKDMDRRFHELNERFNRMEEVLQRLASQSPQITIETIHIHQPVLEKMEYRLDGLDIEHLSGSLNLGNNFGARVGPIPGSSPEKPDIPPPGNRTASSPGQTGTPGTKPPSGSEGGLQRTPTGYRLRRE